MSEVRRLRENANDEDGDEEMFGADIDEMGDDGFEPLEGEEGDLDDDLDEVSLSNVDMTPPPARQTAPRKRHRPRRTPMTKVNEDINDEFSDILAGLEFGNDAHKLNLYRREPAYDPETGRKISGLLDTFPRPIEPEEIQKRFGGGIYEVVIHGRDQRTGRAGIKARRKVEIAGVPLPLPDPREEKRKKELEENKSDGLIESLMEREERRAEAQRQEQMALRRELATMQTKMFEMVAKANENRTDPAAALAPILSSMADNTARQEALRVDDQRRTEDRRKEEREEQRHREDERQRQWEAEQQRQERQFQLQLEQVKADQARAAAESSARAEAERNNMNMMMQFMTKTDSDKESRSRESTALQMQMFQSMNEQNSKFAEAQIRSLERQVSNKDDFFGSIEKFGAIRDLINPPDNDDRPGWERAIDKIGEVGSGLIPGVMAIAQGRAQAPGVAPPLPQNGGPRRVGPGTVVVVDDIDGEYEQPEYEQPHQLQEPQVMEPETKEKTVNAPQEGEMPVNPLTEFPTEFPADFTQSFTLLVQSLDLAMQRELSIDEMHEKCVVPLPKVHKMMLKGFGAEAIVDYVENKAGVPPDWAIRSLDAEEQIYALYERLAAAD